MTEASEDLDDLDLSKEDLDALERVSDGFLGFRCKKRMAPQSSQWSDDMKAAALAAAGGGDTDAVSMSDRLFPKDVAENVPAVKEMNDALSEVNKLCTDRYYTLWHPDPGVRLVRKGREADLREKIKECVVKIKTAAQKMNESRELIKTIMRQKFVARYQRHAKVYDLDFTKLYSVEFRFMNFEVPSYLKHNEELYNEAKQEAQKEAAAVVLAEKEIMAKTLFEVLDHLVERLESRRILDKRHEVISEEIHGVQRVVTYVPLGEKSKVENYRTVELTEEEYVERVSDSTKRKTFTTATASRVFDEIKYAKHQLDQTGIGAGPLAEVFEKLETAVGSQTKESFAASLRQSEGYREAMVERLSSLGDSVLGLSVLDAKRDVIRGRGKSRSLSNKT